MQSKRVGRNAENQRIRVEIIWEKCYNNFNYLAECGKFKEGGEAYDGKKDREFKKDS